MAPSRPWEMLVIRLFTINGNSFSKNDMSSSDKTLINSFSFSSTALSLLEIGQASLKPSMFCLSLVVKYDLVSI
jgi:hypothetical protein